MERNLLRTWMKSSAISIVERPSLTSDRVDLPRKVVFLLSPPKWSYHKQEVSPFTVGMYETL